MGWLTALITEERDPKANYVVLIGSQNHASLHKNNRKLLLHTKQENGVKTASEGMEVGHCSMLIAFNCCSDLELPFCQL